MNIPSYFQIFIYLEDLNIDEDTFLLRVKRVALEPTDHSSTPDLIFKKTH